MGELSALYTDSLELKKFAIETTDTELEKTIASVETAYIALLELLKKPGILSHATELEAALEASDEILSLMMGPLSIGAGTIDEYCNAGREIDGKFKEIGKKYAPHITVLEQAAKKAEKKK